MLQFTVRPEIPADFPGVHEVHAQAFGRENEALLVDQLRGIAGFDPALSLVAQLASEAWSGNDASGPAGEVVGHILFTPVAIMREGVACAAGLALAPLAVLPAFQRQGVGEALTRAGLAACRVRGHRLVIVVGHAEYYPRFGFRSARAVGLEAPFPVSDASFMALDLQRAAGPVRDEVHGLIQYAEPFSRA